jgi:hypothetical protein
MMKNNVTSYPSADEFIHSKKNNQEITELVPEDGNKKETLNKLKKDLM